ncbi:MAG TPA: response regulator [Pyrinomonadaceae bacterium]|nr:response regulator [Pyrinomonadaceae bacterium]
MKPKRTEPQGEALSSIQAEHFDLYLLDGWLPELDNFELCRQMRCYDSHTPILFLSRASREADKKMGHQAGTNAYVIKPDVSHLLGVFTFESPVSLDPLAPEPEVTKPRGEGAKDEQHAEGHKKNRKPQNEK